MGVVDNDINAKLDVSSNVNSILNSSFQNVSISLDAVALIFCVILLVLFLWCGLRFRRKLSSIEKDLSIFIKFSKISPHSQEDV